MKCNPAGIIRTSSLNERVRFKDGNTPDIITAIMEMDKVGNEWVKQKGVECLRGKDDYQTLRNVWRFVKSNVRYSPDRTGREVVKSPGALFRIGVGDCKSFSIAEVSLLRALGFKNIYYRFTSYKHDTIVTHVYVVVKLKGEEVYLDATHTKFDDEVRYTHKRDIKARSVAKVSGIGRTETASNTKQVFGIALLAWAILT
ncbi:MAG: transglutaminase-like domain-containing protein [Saprospiraceae bacterium]